jgi:hypothetical protein
MPESVKPQDYGTVLLPPSQAAAVQRTFVDLGQYTATSTISRLAMLFDRRAVIREIWFVADSVPSDADGTLLIDVAVRDASEDAFVTIVDDFDAEAQLTTAFEAKQATLAAETAEHQLTVEAGDGLRVQLINNSVAIDTNPRIGILVVYQVLGTL